MTTNRKSARTRILNFLMGGGDITVNQARSRFGIENVYARVNELRNVGYPIYTNRKTINGHKVRVYRMGKLPKAVAKVPANTSRGKMLRRQVLTGIAA